MNSPAEGEFIGRHRYSLCPRVPLVLVLAEADGQAGATQIENDLVSYCKVQP